MRWRETWIDRLSLEKTYTSTKNICSSLTKLSRTSWPMLNFGRGEDDSPSTSYLFTVVNLCNYQVVVCWLSNIYKLEIMIRLFDSNVQNHQKSSTSPPCLPGWPKTTEIQIIPAYSHQLQPVISYHDCSISPHHSFPRDIHHLRDVYSTLGW